MWKRDLQPLENEKQIEPVFNTEVLNMKSFERNCSDKSSEHNDYLKYILPATTANSTRFRIEKSMDCWENLMEPESSAFLSGYPYMKLVEGEIKIHQILSQN